MAGKRAEPAVDVSLGYAADEHGHGIVYARRHGAAEAHLIRIPFRFKRLLGVRGRDVSYAAMNAFANYAAEQQWRSIVVRICDDELIKDFALRRDLPPELAMAYVRLGCALNRFRAYRLAGGGAECADLTARARAEATLHIAA